MSIPEEKLQGVDEALEDLGKSAEEIAEVRNRFAGAEAASLEAVDAQLSELSEGVAVHLPAPNAQIGESRAPGEADASWDDEATEVEILDESDFVLLVDEDDLEELEKVGEDDAMKTTPPELPQEDDEEGDGFFKKLFSGRRSRPPQQ